MAELKVLLEILFGLTIFGEISIGLLTIFSIWLLIEFVRKLIRKES